MDVKEAKRLQVGTCIIHIPTVTPGIVKAVGWTGLSILWHGADKPTKIKWTDVDELETSLGTLAMMRNTIEARDKLAAQPSLKFAMSSADAPALQDDRRFLPIGSSTFASREASAEAARTAALVSMCTRLRRSLALAAPYTPQRIRESLEMVGNEADKLLNEVAKS